MEKLKKTFCIIFFGIGIILIIKFILLTVVLINKKGNPESLMCIILIIPTIIFGSSFISISRLIYKEFLNKTNNLKNLAYILSTLFVILLFFFLFGFVGDKFTIILILIGAVMLILYIILTLLTYYLRKTS